VIFQLTEYVKRQLKLHIAFYNYNARNSYIIIQNIQNQTSSNTKFVDTNVLKDTFIKNNPISYAKVNCLSAMPKFEIYKDTAGKFRWRLKAPNGEIIASSGEGYESKDNCKNGIQSVKTNVPNATIVEMMTQ